MPKKLTQFLNLIKEKLFFNNEKDEIVVIHEKDLRKAGFSDSDVKQVVDFLKREGAIAKVRLSAAREESVIPVDPGEKKQLFGVSLREFFAGNDPVHWLVIEIGSREKLQKLTDVTGFQKGLIQLPLRSPLREKRELDSLHSEILKKCKSLYEKEEYAEAVEKGFKVV